MKCNEWQIYKLEDVAEKIFSGGTPSTKKEEYWNGGIPWLSSGETRNKFINNTEKTITNEGIKNSSTKKVNVGDLVIASAGQGFTRGQVSYCNIETYINQSIIAIRCNSKIINSLFLYYNISNRYNELRQISDGHSIRGSLTTNIIKKLEVNIPSLEEQRIIAEILFSLDKKIELNNEMNKTLEEMAQALFKRWFVDFEFPNENGEPYKSSGGEMVDSDMRMIPKGWEVKLISEIIEIKDGTHASPKPKEEGHPLITSKHISGDKIDFKSANLISQEDYEEVNKRSKVDNGDILISMIGTVGLIHLIQEEDIKFAIKNVGLFKTSQKDVLSEYLYLFLKSNDMKNYIEARLAGTTQKYISLGELRKIKFVLPSDDVINNFKSIVGDIFNRKRKNIEQNDSLIDIRDLLLSKLMSGEIRVSDIDKANL